VWANSSNYSNMVRSPVEPLWSSADSTQIYDGTAVQEQPYETQLFNLGRFTAYVRERTDRAV